MSSERISVMSPEAGLQRGVGRFPLGMNGPAPSSPSFAKRLDTLENKTVYLVDMGFSGSDKFMKQLQTWFAGHMPSVATVIRRKPDNVFRDESNELWEEVKAKGDAVVLGVAG